jgi:hypothetical protein
MSAHPVLRAAALGLLALGLLLGGTAHAQTAALFTLGLTTPIELNARGASADVIVPLTVAAGLAAGDKLNAPVVQDVALGTRHDGAFRDAVTVTWFTQDGVPRPLGLKVHVDLNTLAETGTYTVTVALTATGDAAQPKTQGLTFQLTHPAASLTAVAALKLEHVGFFFSPGEGLPTKLRLHESTRRSRLTEVTLEDKGTGEVLVQRQTAGQDASPLTVPAGETVFVPLEVTGNRTLGTHSGMLTLRAPQLASPVEVAYEVIVRHPKWMIPAVLLLGLGIGFFTRIFLRNRIEKRKAQDDLLMQWQALEQERSRYPDAGYQERLKAIAGNLDRAGTEGKVEEMRTALQTARTDLLAAQEALSHQRKAAGTRAGQLKALLEKGRQLPTRLSQPMVQAAQALREALTRVDTDPTGVLVQLEAAESGLNTRLLQEATEWRRTLRMQAVLSELPLETEVQTQLGGQWTALQQSMEPLQDGLESQPLLESLEDSFAKARTFSEQLQTQVVSRVRSTLEILEQGMQDLEHFKTLRTRTDAFAQRRNDWERAEGLAALYREARTLLEALAGLIRSQTPPAAEAAVSALLEEYRYEEAARAAVPAAKPPPETMLGPQPLFFGGEDDRESSPLPARSTSAPTDMLLRDTLKQVPSLLAAGMGGPSLTLHQLQARNLRALFWEQALRSVLVWLVLVFAAFLLFEKAFIGTFMDYATLFFWAFTTDASVEAIERIMPSTKKPVT